MSHISEFFDQVNETPIARPAVEKNCFTTASKTGKIYRSQRKTCNRMVSYTADIIAANEEFEHPETATFITKTAWSVYKVSPLWNLQFKESNQADHEFVLAHRLEYDESALKRYAAVIRGFLMKDCSDVADYMCEVVMSPLRGLRGSRNDKEALKIEVNSVLGTGRRLLFIGVLCGVETVELQVSSTAGTALPVLLTSGNLDLTDRVIHGLTKCFDCVVSPLLFSDYEMKWIAALWTGLDTEEITNSIEEVECTIEMEPRKKKQRAAKANSSILTSTRIEPKAKTKEKDKPPKAKVAISDDIVFQYSVPAEFKCDKISSFILTLSANEVKELWRCIHKVEETEFTETEMVTFHTSLNKHIQASLGLRVNKLQLHEIKLPVVTVSSAGRVRIHSSHHVKVILRHLTAMCQGDILCANPTLGVIEESL